MKKTLTIVGRALLCGILLCATILCFMVAVVTINEQPLVWLASCLGCIASFVTAIGISLGAFEHESAKTAPRATTRTAASGNASDTVAA